ncbi:MAG TPA: DUF5995 family protein, partial [Solirubrobacteraceae bacterium]
ALLGAATVARAATPPPIQVPWTTYLPAGPGPTSPQPHAVPYCRYGRVSCVQTELRRLTRLRDRLGCDHRAVFATTYLELTRELYREVRRHPHLFAHPRYLYYEDALFADVYFNTFRAAEQGKRVAPAWRIAFATARGDGANAAQDMLLGINAHVQNDMPFVLAALGQRTPRGASRKADHDVMNDVLGRAYIPVVEAIRRRYDAVLDITNPSWSPVDDIAGLELVREWREVVWRNAEALLRARTAAERRAVTASIQANAANWARVIAAPSVPDYRATRDPYCARQVLGR